MTELVPGSLFDDVRQLIESVRSRAAAAVNAELTLLYWQIGRRIREDVRGNQVVLKPAGKPVAILRQPEAVGLRMRRRKRLVEFLQASKIPWSGREASSIASA